MTKKLPIALNAVLLAALAAVLAVLVLGKNGSDAAAEGAETPVATSGERTQPELKSARPLHTMYIGEITAAFVKTAYLGT